MIRNLAIRPLADSDIDAQADYYTVEAGIETGIRFLDAIQRTFVTLLRDSKSELELISPHQGCGICDDGMLRVSTTSWFSIAIPKKE